MNKNIVKLFAIVMMIFMIGAALVACGAQGEQGEQGVPGPQGPQGTQGNDGAPGLTPYIGANGNWWVGDQDTGVCPQGKDALRCENHDWDEVYITIAEHTQDSIGLYLKVCVDCDGAEILRVGHELVKGETVAPTCQADGYTVYTCACGYSEKKDVTAKIDHILGAKEYTKNESGICDCEWTNPYVQHCTMCGIVLVSDQDGKKDHVWGEYNPEKITATTNPCTWVGGTVAECVNCSCEGHINRIPNETAKGHTWSNWELVAKADGKYTLERTCSVCSAKFAEGTEQKVITLTDCGEPTVTPAECEKDGKKVYSYTIDGQTLTIDTVVIPATGHTVAEDSAYTVAKDHSSITTKCVDCDKELTLELPALEIKKAYQIVNGDCDEPIDTYTILLTDKNEKVNGAILVTFTVPAEYGHNNGNLGTGAKVIVIEVNGVDYDAYWCETCQHWIVYQEHVA